MKRNQTRMFRDGMRVLYAGAGTGQEVESALLRGVEATLLDASPEMLQRAELRLGKASGKVVFCCEDVFAHRPSQPYDSVVANFFLNVFAQPVVPRVLEQLCAWLKPGGTLLIGDFRAPAPGPVQKALQWAYYLPPLALFRVMTGNAWHPLYDYRPIAERCGLTFAGETTARVFRFGPAWLSTLAFKKPVQPPSGSVP